MTTRVPFAWRCLGKPFTQQNVAMDADDQHFLVTGSIQDADPCALGEIRSRAPQEGVLQMRLGCLKLNTSQPCGLAPDMTCMIEPSLPAAPMAWNTRRMA